MKPHTALNDSDLLQSMLTGDEEALAELYRRRRQGVYRFVLHMCGSGSVAEDVTQEVFMVLIHDSHSFDPARGSLNGFLIGVARNQLLRRLRREQFYVAIGDDLSAEGSIEPSAPASEEPFNALSRTELIASVRRAVLALPERYREVVVLCDLHELSYVEAAEALDCAVGTVRSRLHRARALLIEKLRPVQQGEATAATTKTARCFA
jgi:RNA polymerase sigma-70 factor, ECF subfamily